MTEESSKQSAANLTDLFLDEAGLEGGLDIPPEPASEREAEEAEDRAIETERADECEEDVETPSGPSRIIALTGACGGAGTTSIALQMASRNPARRRGSAIKLKHVRKSACSILTSKAAVLPMR